MISKDELKLAKILRQNSTWEDTILISDTHLHWAPVSSGRRVFLGYTGWLWSWGMDYLDKQQQAIAMYQNTPEGRDLLEQNSIDFIVTDDLTREKYWSDNRYFESKYEKIAEFGQYQLFKL